MGPTDNRFFTKLLRWASNHSVLVIVFAVLSGLIGLALIVVLVVQASQFISRSQSEATQPTVRIYPERGGPGTEITIAGNGWKPADLVFVRLDDPVSGDRTYAYTSAVVTDNGVFATSFNFPPDEQWANLATVMITAWSPASDDEVSVEFDVLPEEPTATPVPTQTPSPTVTPLPTDTPTNTPTPAPTSTPTMTPTPSPTLTPSPTPQAWRGEYYDNRNLAGEAVVRDDPQIDFVWGEGAPLGGLPADNFSIRWTGQPSFAAGTYRFYAASDDGMRVWIDGELVIDEWHYASGVVYTVEKVLAQGAHALRVEYFEASESASVSFRWERVGELARWKGEYFSNPTLVGSPALVRDEESIRFDWGWWSPGSGVPADNFSARWTRTLSFEPGTYRFRALVDDGVRVYIDGILVIDEWRVGSRREVTADRSVSAGNHHLRIEYFESSGAASLQFGWEQIPNPVFVYWKGEYWPNRGLEDAPVLVRDDRVIDFDWGLDAPAVVLPRDNFSARWTRQVRFEGGSYRFHALVDDGVRLWVDNALVIDDWQVGGARELTTDLSLIDGAHDIRVEYFDLTQNAQIRIWWEKLPASSFSEWRAEYWANRYLSGNPVLVRNDRTIDFDWAAGSPVLGMPVDGFSVRWGDTLNFTSNTYRFYAFADDGLRIYVDGSLVLDEWHDSDGSLTYTVDLYLSGEHWIVVDYYENSAGARVKVWWEALATPTPTAPSLPSPTPTETPSPTLTASATPTSSPTPTLTPTSE